MISKNSGNFIEEHIEKIVLVIAALACIYPLYKYVLLGSGDFLFEGRQLSAGRLDTVISEEAMKLKSRIEGEAVTKTAYEPNAVRFAAKMGSSVDIDKNILWPVPSAVEERIDKKYRIPTIGPVKDVIAGQVRAAAYVPVKEITMENYSQQESYEPNDIDIVTVQGSFDYAGMTDSFAECFSGKDVPEGWRDESKAKPVFAAVDLERQKMGADGNWGEWEGISRQKIDPRREDFKTIEDVNELPSRSVAVRMLRFNDAKVQTSLLQPETYQIASAEEEWFPPSLHDKFLSIQRDRESQEKRDAIEQKASEQKTANQQQKQRTATAPPAAAGRGGGAGGGEADYMRMMMGGGGGPGGGRPAARPDTRRPEVATRPAETAKVAKPDPETALYDEMKKINLSDKDLSKEKGPIVFWSHDDTTEPGSTYRYRIRIGVFNPVAGTGQVLAGDMAYDGKAILWSDYSGVTDPLTIPKRIYFFPVNVQEVAKGVDVQVSKYMLGYWYNTQFLVKRGEVIGKEAKLEDIEKEKPKPRSKDQQADAAKDDSKNLTQPEKIDFTTGAMLVDIVPSQDWAGDKNLQNRQFFDMLYSYDGTNIEKMATKLMYWSDEYRKKYTEIQSMERKTKLAFRAWNSTTGFTGTRRTYNPRMPGGAPGDKGGGMSPEEMYMMMMRGGMPGQGR